MAKILELQLHNRSFQWIFRVDFLQDWLVLSCSPRDPQEFSPAPQPENSNSSVLSLIYGLSHLYMITGKTTALTIWIFVGKGISLFLNILSRFVIAFLPQSKRHSILWLQSQSSVILEPKKTISVNVSIFSPSFCYKVMGLNAMILVFWMLSFKPAFSLSSFSLTKRLFSFSSLSAIRVASSAYLRLLIFLPAILIPACDSSSLAFQMMYSAYKLNKQGDNIQP